MVRSEKRYTVVVTRVREHRPAVIEHIAKDFVTGNIVPTAGDILRLGSFPIDGIPCPPIDLKVSRRVIDPESEKCVLYTETRLPLAAVNTLRSRGGWYAFKSENE